MRRSPALVLATVLAASSLWGCRTHAFAELDAVYPNTRDPNAPDASLGAFGLKAGDAFFLSGRVHSTPLATANVTQLEYRADDVRRLGLSTRALHARAHLVDTAHVGYRLVIVRLLDAWTTTDSLRVAFAREPLLRTRLAAAHTRLVDAVALIYAYERQSASDQRISGTAVVRNDTIFQGESSRQRTQFLSLSDGTVVRYRLAKLCWNADTTAVISLVPDLRGKSDEEQYCSGGHLLAKGKPSTSTRRGS